METSDQYVHRAMKCDRPVARASADGSLHPLFPLWGCRPTPRRAEVSSTTDGFAPKPPSGGFAPPVPQGSGGRLPNQTINSNPKNHNALRNSC